MSYQELTLVGLEKLDKYFFYIMHQLVAILCTKLIWFFLPYSVANNLDVIDLEDGILKEFLEKTKDETPEEKAKKLEDSADVCDVHDTIAKQGQTAVSFPLFWMGPFSNLSWVLLHFQVCCATWNLLHFLIYKSMINDAILASKSSTKT